MRYRLLLLPLLVALLTGCQKPTIIPDEELALIFHDAFLTNSYYKNKNLKRDSLMVYEPIFEHYGYTTEDVQYTIGNFSKRKSARLGDVVELAIDMLEEEGLRLNKAVTDLDSINSAALRFSERVIFEDSLIRVDRLRDTSRLMFLFDSVRPGEYRISAHYRIDSIDENPGLRFQCWGETADSTIKGMHYMLLRRERDEHFERTLKSDSTFHKIKFNFWVPRKGEKPQRPAIELRDVKVYYKMETEEALNSLYDHLLHIRIFADDFLRTIEADSLALPADTTRLVE